MKKLIVLFITIISLSSCFNKGIEKTQTWTINQTWTTEVNTWEIQRKVEMYWNIEILDFPVNQIIKLDKLPYPILSDKEPTCKEWEQKVNFKKANMTYCISKEYIWCKDPHPQCNGSVPINEALNIYNKTTNWLILYDYYPYNKFPKLIDVEPGYIDGSISVHSKVYNYNNIFIIENYDEKKGILLDTSFYIFLKNGYIKIDHDDISYNDDENPNAKRLLETLYIPEQN